MIENEFVPYVPSLELKELGFDEPCFGLYHNDKTFYPTQCKSHEQFHGQVCSAPLYQQVFRWFEKHFGLYVEWLVDGWGKDECISSENICYRIFIWEVGKPKPHHNSDLGTGSREQMNPVVLKELIRIANAGPDWDSLNGFEMDELD